MIISRITLYHARNKWTVKIEHNGRVVKGTHPTNSAFAYSDAVTKLVVQPGYVMEVPASEFKHNG